MRGNCFIGEVPFDLGVVTPWAVADLPSPGASRSMLSEDLFSKRLIQACGGCAQRDRGPGGLACSTVTPGNHSQKFGGLGRKGTHSLRCYTVLQLLQCPP